MAIPKCTKRPRQQASPFLGDQQGNVRKLEAVRIGPPEFAPQRGTEFTLDADVVLVRNGMLGRLGVTLDARAT